MENHELSPSGDPIRRYDSAKPKDFTPAFGDSQNIDIISNHIEQHIGKIEAVFHEIVSDLVHIDVHWVKPSKRFPFHTLATSGMSDKAMHVPEGLEEYRYAELCILLPENWKIDGKNHIEEVFKDESNYWPVRWLKIIACFPHEYDTWVGYGHTIPNGEDASPFADNTKVGCMLLLPGLSLSPHFFKLEVDDAKTISFFCLYPIYKEEMDFKLEKGLDALLDKFEKYNIVDVVDVSRENTCLKKDFREL